MKRIKFKKILNFKKMTGINFIINDKGDRRAVLIDLKRYGKLWENFYDILKTNKRKNEPRETFASVKARFNKIKSK